MLKRPDGDGTIYEWEGGRKEVSKVGGVSKGARKGRMEGRKVMWWAEGRKKEREESERAGRRK